MNRTKQKGFLLNPFRFSGAPTEDAYRDLMLSLGPAAYWRLDETAGTACADSSGNGRNASYFVDASTITSSGLLSASDNRGLMLPSQSINLKSGFEVPLPITTETPWTIAALVRPDGANSGFDNGVIAQLGYVDGSGSPNVPEIGALDSGGGKFRLRVMRSGIAQLFTSPEYDYGTRLHIALTYQSSEIRLYINGVLTNSYGHTYSGNPGNAKFGHAVFPGTTNHYPFFGKMDEVALFSSVLTDAQIAALYAAS